MCSNPLGQKDPEAGNGNHSVSLFGGFHGLSCGVFWKISDYSLWGRKELGTTGSTMSTQGRTRTLIKAMMLLENCV